MTDTDRKRLLARLSRGVVYSAPLLIAVTGAASLHAIVSDIRTPPESAGVERDSAAPGATPEATPEAMPEAAPEATPEAMPEATPEAAPEAMPEASPEASY